MRVPGPKNPVVKALQAKHGEAAPALPAQPSYPGLQRGQEPQAQGRGTIKPYGQPQAGPEGFKEWFGASQVVDASGRPLVVYHGTKEAFEVFDQEKTMDGAFWFTENRQGLEAGEVGAAGAGVVMPVYLSCQKLAGWDEYERLTYDQIMAEGFDGLKLDEDFIVFDPEKIRLVAQAGLVREPSPEPVLPRNLKTGRPHFCLNGDDEGNWAVSSYDLGWRKDWSWQAAAGLSLRNEHQNLAVEGATELHPGFQKAMAEAVQQYPELQNYLVSFDGPYKPLPEALGAPGMAALPWPEITFYHGTYMLIGV